MSFETIHELHAAVLQTVVTAGLAALCGWLYREYRKPVFAWWAAAWGLYVLRPVIIGAFVVVRAPILLYWHQVLTGWTALAVLATALVFSRRLRWRHWYALLVLFPPVWSYIAIYKIHNFMFAAAPAVLFLSVATLWTGVVFLRYALRSRSPGAAVLAGAFLLWGLHHLDYPFLRAQGAWMPWGYYLDILFTLAVGGGMLLLISDDLRRGSEALATLASAWEGAATTSRATLLGVVLERAAALPAVRGAALVRLADGVYERGAGMCTAWAGATADTHDTQVLERAAREGTTIFAPRWYAPVTPSDGAAPRKFPYAAVLPVPVGDSDTRALVLVADDYEPFAALDTDFLAAFGRQVGGALSHAAVCDTLAHRTGELERLSARMVVQHEDERRRLARELHDETAQLLTAVKLELGMLRSTLGAGDQDRVDDALALTDAGIRSIRAVIQDLRPSLLDDLGLLPALRSVATAFATRSGMDVSLDLIAAADLPAMAPDAELALFRAVQEALANIGRHADASAVWVTLRAQHDNLTLTVRDNGCGPQPGAQRFGMGVVGMHERFVQLGGRVTLFMAPEGGACLEARLPIANGAAA
jgi:signal transduction histidine kinase